MNRMRLPLEMKWIDEKTFRMLATDFKCRASRYVRRYPNTADERD
jgi:hypothetical protein